MVDVKRSYMEKNVNKKLIKYNVSNGVVKSPRSHAFTKGYLQKATTIEQLINDIDSKKCIWPVVAKNGQNHRKSENVLGTEIVILNISEYESFDEVVKTFADSAVYIYEVESETGLRIRAVLVLDQFLNCIELEYFLRIAQVEFAHNHRCIDAAHAYINEHIITRYILSESNRFKVSDLFNKYVFDSNFNSSFESKWNIDDQGSFSEFKNEVIRKYSLSPALNTPVSVSRNVYLIEILQNNKVA